MFSIFTFLKGKVVWFQIKYKISLPWVLKKSHKGSFCFSNPWTSCDAPWDHTRYQLSTETCAEYIIFIKHRKGDGIVFFLLHLISTPSCVDWKVFVLIQIISLKSFRPSFLSVQSIPNTNSIFPPSGINHADEQNISHFPKNNVINFTFHRNFRE